MCKLKKTSKLRVTGRYEENSSGTDGFPVQRACNAENVPIWWRYHVSRNGYITTTKSKVRDFFVFFARNVLQIHVRNILVGHSNLDGILSRIGRHRNT